MILSILDKHFRRTGRYEHQHIPLPLGSYDHGYYYKFVEGEEGFPWELQDPSVPFLRLTLLEFIPFSNSFNSFGVGVSNDIADVNDGAVAKNIIMSPNAYRLGELYETFTLPATWMRIDFGLLSCPVDFGTFSKKVKKVRGALIESVGKEASRIIELYAMFVNKNLSEDHAASFRQLIYQHRLEIAQSLL